MSNNYFKFKQFTVTQDICAMKVGTDGVLLGAWTNLPNCGNVLDIGSGTGLISLMCAQRNSKISITAVDIDEKACLQSKNNFFKSKWSDRLHIVNQSIVDFSKTHANEFDAIISNPPFFNENVLSANNRRNVARHSNTLSFEELVLSVNLLLTPDGFASFIIPHNRKDEFILLCNSYTLCVSRICSVKPTTAKKPNRVLFEISKHKLDIEYSEMILEKYGRHNYSEEFIGLMSEFYLKL